MPESRRAASLLDAAEELGLRRTRIALAVLAVAVAPAATALALGASAPLAGLTSLAATVPALLAARRSLRLLTQDLRAPLDDMTSALEELRGGGKAHRLGEAGPPAIRAMLRRFNQACSSIEERDQLSQANLLSVEVAFDRVHSVLQSLREGVIVVDVDGKVVLANRSARNVLEAGGAPIEGQPLTRLLSGDLQQEVRNGLQRIDSNQAREISAADIHHDGAIYDLTVVHVHSTRPDHDFGKVVVLVDVTQNHEVNKLKDDLLSSISHELRTPLTNLCSSTEILAQMSSDDEADWREFVQIIGAESFRLKGLVDDVLEYTQLETGQIHYRSEPVEIDQLARASLQMFEDRAKDKGIRMEVAAETDAAMAMVDRQWIGKVLGRLLDNALKFTPEGGRIRVGVKDTEDGVMVTVDDSGCGIDNEHRELVFERFQQLGDIMTDKPKGTGLGLPICRTIVQALGGNIDCADSDLGGARLRLRLPRSKAATVRRSGAGPACRALAPHDERR